MIIHESLHTDRPHVIQSAFTGRDRVPAVTPAALLAFSPWKETTFTLGVQWKTLDSTAGRGPWRPVDRGAECSRHWPSAPRRSSCDAARHSLRSGRPEACAAASREIPVPMATPASTTLVMTAIPTQAGPIAPEFASRYPITPVRRCFASRARRVARIVAASAYHQMSRAPTIFASMSLVTRPPVDRANTAVTKAAAAASRWARAVRASSARRAMIRASRAAHRIADRMSIAAIRAAASAHRSAEVALRCTVSRPAASHAGRLSARRDRSVAMRAAASAPLRARCAS
jgi:hypothetical protein